MLFQIKDSIEDQLESTIVARVVPSGESGVELESVESEHVESSVTSTSFSTIGKEGDEFVQTLRCALYHKMRDTQDVLDNLYGRGLYVSLYIDSINSVDLSIESWGKTPFTILRSLREYEIKAKEENVPLAKSFLGITETFHAEFNALAHEVYNRLKCYYPYLLDKSSLLQVCARLFSHASLSILDL